MTEVVDVHAPAATPTVVSERRLDIQALRALAVLMVIVYHFWPSALPGGFIGVDVFFVISGYLITGHLYRHPPSDVKSFAAFWSRRILRLIPAAAAAITGTLLLVVLVLSQAEWTAAARHATASMLYVENWLLIADSTDYLRSQANPSAFQHFWSLSVEEQFYVVWPLVIGAGAAAFGRDPDRRRRMFGFLLITITVASFLYGLLTTWSNPAVAYFASPARMWELAIGGVLAVTSINSSSTPRSALAAWLNGHLARTVLLWSALTVLVVASFAISSTTPFPGWAALAPALATVALLHAGDLDGRFSIRQLTHTRPVQFLGDVSYAAYLWHWPLVVLVPVAVASSTPSVPDSWVRPALLPVVALLAWLSTRFLEDPLRRVPPGHSLLRRAFFSLVVSTILVVGIAGGVSAVVKSRTDAVRANVNALMKDLGSAPCLGAAAMEPGADCDGAPEVTTPEFARGDIPSSIRVGECINWPPFEEFVSCDLGKLENPTKRIALFGNSHAGHWQPALESLAEAQNWQVDTFVIGICQPSLEPVSQAEGVGYLTPAQLTEICPDVVGEGLKRITNDGYDLVVMSTMDHDPAHATDAGNVYRSTLETITDAGVPVLVLRDTPHSMDQANDTPTCLGLNPDDPGACAGAPADWIRPDPLMEAAEASRSPLVHRLDLNRYLCSDDTCPPRIGGVVVYADFNHMSATFNRTLAPYLQRPLLAAMTDK